jgi:hypothetical protein
MKHVNEDLSSIFRMRLWFTPESRGRWPRSDRRADREVDEHLGRQLHTNQRVSESAIRPNDAPVENKKGDWTGLTPAAGLERSVLKFLRFANLPALILNRSGFACLFFRLLSERLRVGRNVPRIVLGPLFGAPVLVLALVRVLLRGTKVVAPSASATIRSEVGVIVVKLILVPLALLAPLLGTGTRAGITGCELVLQGEKE